MRHADRIAFIKRGAFSHTNESVLNQLRRQFPRLAIDVIDVAAMPVLGWRNLPRIGLGALRRYGAASLRSKKALLHSMVYSPEFFSVSRKLLAQRLEQSKYLFTFQTQGLFDASVPGTPHFLYTDHTHLANLEYPSFRREDLSCREWIEMERSVYRHATVNLTMSSNVSRSLVQDYGCDPERVECVYVGTNAEPEKNVQARRPKDKTILFVGVAWERKGGPVLVDAFKRVLEVHPTAELIVVGCSPDIDVPRCTVVGRVPLNQVGAYYHEASLLCVPTRIEPFGIVFVEALARGVPVVATRIGALPDFIIDGETGYLVPPDDPQALAARLIELLGDADRQRRMGERGQRLVSSRYTWDNVGAAMKTAIERRLN
jgi:glycosyltransferase involved in cell wall biosynthesis